MKNKKITHKHDLLPPAFIITGGKKYLIPGWKEVPLETKLEDIKWEKKKPLSTPKSNVEIFEFKSSSSNEVYITKRYKGIDGTIKYSCNCPGSWRTRGNCKHVKEIRSKSNK